MSTPYMNLILPVVGPLGTQGPDWANEINTALTLIDQHDHSSGLGKQITPAGININQTLQMNSQQLSEIASLALDNLSSQPASANLIYEYAGELYFNDANANQVQLTLGGTINVASVGTISGDYGGSNPANVSFSNITDTYLFTKAPGVTGSIACGPVSIYQNASSSYYAKFQQNVAQASNLDWTLPVDYPATKLPIKSSASGVLELSQIVTSEIADAQVTAVKLATDSVETLKIKDLNVTTGKLADLSVTTGKIANQAVTTTQIAANTIDDSNISTSANIARTKFQPMGLLTSSAALTGSYSSSSYATIWSSTFNCTTNRMIMSINSGYGGSSVANWILTAPSAGSAEAYIRVLHNGTQLYQTRIKGYNSSTTNVIYPANVFDSVLFTNFIGTYTLEFQVRVFGFLDWQNIVFNILLP